jgi:hypothetical protein
LDQAYEVIKDYFIDWSLFLYSSNKHIKHLFAFSLTFVV